MTLRAFEIPSYFYQTLSFWTAAFLKYFHKIFLESQVLFDLVGGKKEIFSMKQQDPFTLGPNISWLYFTDWKKSCQLEDVGGEWDCGPVRLYIIALSRKYVWRLPLLITAEREEELPAGISENVKEDQSSTLSVQSDSKGQ